MKKVISSVLLLGLFSFGLIAQVPEPTEPKQAKPTDKINWISWEEMVEASKEQPKKVFVDVYTDWCGWCKRMDATTFIDPTIVNYMNTNYYAVKLDAEMKETISFNGHDFINPNPEGKRSTHTLAASLLDYQLSYPSFVVLDENFKRVHIIKGFQKPEPLLGTMLFFKTNEFLRYKDYLINQELKLPQQQQAKPQPVSQENKNG